MFKPNSNDNDNDMEIRKALIDLLRKLVNYFDEFTYYNKNETIPLLLLSKNKYLRKILFGINFDSDKQFGISDIRKYEKGAFKKEVMSTIKDIVQLIVNLEQKTDLNNSNLLSRIFHRQ